MWRQTPLKRNPRYNEFILTVPTHNLPRYNEYFVLSLAGSKNDMMIQMVDKPNTTPIGQERETLTFKALLYLRTFARNFSNIDFFLKLLPLKDDELAMSEM